MTAEAGPEKAVNASFYRWYVLAVLTLVYATNIADRFLLSALIEPIKSELMLSDTALGFLTGFAFAIFYTLMGFPLAYMADRFNRRNLVAIAVGAYSVMTAICGTAQSFLQLSLARVGVGVGEAGATPPSHSMISDMFPREQRSFALAIYSLGASIGVSVGLYFGGLINELYGWRYAFFFMAIPGLIFALLVRLTLREPSRGAAEGRAADQQAAPDLRSTLEFMWSQKSLRHIILGGSVLNIYAIALTIWMPAFMVRSHGVSVREASEVLALLYGSGGAIGLIVGGYITDLLGRRDVRWHAGVTIIVVLASLLPTVAILLLSKGWAFYACNFIFGIANYMFLGPLFAMTQNLVGVRMRALGSAMLMFAINLLGMGMGPQVIGVLSDLFQPSMGQESLRYALLIVAVISPLWGIWHYYAATRTLRSDYQRAQLA